MKTDMQVQRDVIEQLQFEPILNAAEIGVAVKNGIVTLSGKVDSYFKKMAAERAVKKVAGVKAVAEDLQVGISPAFRKTDAEIAESVFNTLKWHTSIPDEKLKVKVENGVVTLEGEVEWEYQRNAAKIAVDSLSGVVRINNCITIKPLATASNVKQKISAALYRSATIDADKITVEILGNRVILSGKVRSFAEQEDAVSAAWSTPGVNFVENKLKVAEAEELVF